jgi:hypothetical protein
MVDASKRRSATGSAQVARDLTAELSDGRVYTLAMSETPHGTWFADDPRLRCEVLDGVEFDSRTTVKTRRGETKSAFKLLFSGARLSTIVDNKRQTNKSYVPVPGNLVDFMTGWSVIALGYSLAKKDQLREDKALAKRNSTDALEAMRATEVEQAMPAHDVLIAAAKEERTALEEQCAGGGRSADVTLKSKQQQIVDLTRSKIDAQGVIKAKYDRPIDLRKKLDLLVAAKKAERKANARKKNKGKGVNSKKRSAALFDSEDSDSESDVIVVHSDQHDDDDDDDDVEVVDTRVLPAATQPAATPPAPPATTPPIAGPLPTPATLDPAAPALGPTAPQPPAPTSWASTFN